jgi:cobalt-zinc-cadmium efflux system protein
MALFQIQKTRSMVYTLCRILLGAIFVYASWGKILDPAAFARIVANYQIVSAGTGRLAALFLPYLELVCGVCLIINRWPRGSALIVAGLMLVFMAALGYNIYRGIDVHCGCFTLNETATGSMWLSLIRDIIFFTMAVGMVLYRRPIGHPAGPA